MCTTPVVERILDKAFTNVDFHERNLVSVVAPHQILNEWPKDKSAQNQHTRKSLKDKLGQTKDLYHLMECCYDKGITNVGDHLIKAILEEVDTSNVGKLGNADKEVVFGLLRRFFTERTNVKSYKKMKELLKNVCILIGKTIFYFTISICFVEEHWTL